MKINRLKKRKKISSETNNTTENKNLPETLTNVRQMLDSDTGQQVMEQMFMFVELEHLYESAIREVKTKLEILDSEFRAKYSYNPIHHIEDRLKSPQSIFEKMQRKGFPINAESMRANILDFAGVRVVCNYIDDIYTVADLLTGQDDVNLIKRKDYISEPKPNGYRSLHLVIETPVYLSDKKEMVNVEVQIRTIAMDFWASLEHELKYKTDTEVSADLAGQLKDCAESIAAIDLKMQQINKTLKEIS